MNKEGKNYSCEDPFFCESKNRKDKQDMIWKKEVAQ